MLHISPLLSNAEQGFLYFWGYWLGVVRNSRNWVGEARTGGTSEQSPFFVHNRTAVTCRLDTAGQNPLWTKMAQVRFGAKITPAMYTRKQPTFNPTYIPSAKDTDRVKRGLWRVRYTGPDGNRYSMSDKNKTALMRSWAEVQEAIDEGQWLPPKPRRINAVTPAPEVVTVEQLLDQWLTARSRGTNPIRESTRQSYKRALDKRIVGSQFGQLDYTKVSKYDVRKWWQDITTAYPTPSTNRKAYIYLKAAYDWAVGEDMIASHEVYLKDAGRKPPSRDKELPTTQELQAILDNVPESYRMVTMLCLFMGLRVGEALGLRVKDINHRSGQWIVSVRGNIQRLHDAGGKVYMQYQPPKTRAGLRDVPVLPRFNEIMEAHMASVAGYRPDAYATQTREGRPVMDTSFRAIFDRAKRKGGVTGHVTPHYGRNWLITHLAELGASPAEIGVVLGQKDLKTITEVYMKARPSHVSQLLGALSESMGDHDG